MIEPLLDALKDTLKMAPIIFAVFAAIELFEHKYGKSLKKMLQRSRSIGPIIGAIFGIIPQCGFSVISTILFAEGAITAGTLLSVYIATSDEAIPLIISQPKKLYVLIPLLLSKFIIAVLSGYIVDIMFLLFKKSRRYEDLRLTEDTYEKDGCCGSTCIQNDFNLNEIIEHSFWHSIKILSYVLVVSVLLSILLYYAKESFLSSILLKGSLLQPVIASLVGLIPNCAASVAITQIFLNGGISFGSAIAGLSSSAGLGLVVLFKEVKNKNDIYLIISLLLIISILSGIIIDSVIPWLSVH